MIYSFSWASFITLFKEMCLHSLPFWSEAFSYFNIIVLHHIHLCAHKICGMCTEKMKFTVHIITTPVYHSMQIESVLAPIWRLLFSSTLKISLPGLLIFFIDYIIIWRIFKTTLTCLTYMLFGVFSIQCLNEKIHFFINHLHFS